MLRMRGHVSAGFFAVKTSKFAIFTYSIQKNF